MIVIAAYDVSEDSRRSRLAAVLQSVGDRIQRSVFVLSIEPSDLEALRTRIAGIIDPDRDSVYIVRQCSTCWDVVVCLGQANPPQPVLYWAAM